MYEFNCYIKDKITVQKMHEMGSFTTRSYWFILLFTYSDKTRADEYHFTFPSEHYCNPIISF